MGRNNRLCGFEGLYGLRVSGVEELWLGISG